MSGSSDQVDTSFIQGQEDQAIGYLNQGLQAALPYSEMFTQESINMQQQALSAQMALAQQQLTSEQENAQIANADIQNYYQQGMALGQPYRQAGYQALDKLNQIVGNQTPQGGSAALVQALTQQAQQQGAQQTLGAQGAALASSLNLSPQNKAMLMQGTAFGANPLAVQQQLQNMNAQPYPLLSPNSGQTPQYSGAQALPNATAMAMNGVMGGQSGQGLQPVPGVGSVSPQLFQGTNAMLNNVSNTMSGPGSPLALNSGYNPISTYLGGALPAYNQYQQALLQTSQPQTAATINAYNNGTISPSSGTGNI
jgi:hypothetical protein